MMRLGHKNREASVLSGGEEDDLSTQDVRRVQSAVEVGGKERRSSLGVGGGIKSSRNLSTKNKGGLSGSDTGSTKHESSDSSSSNKGSSDKKILKRNVSDQSALKQFTGNQTRAKNGSEDGQGDDADKAKRKSAIGNLKSRPAVRKTMSSANFGSEKNNSKVSCDEEDCYKPVARVNWGLGDYYHGDGQSWRVGAAGKIAGASGAAANKSTQGVHAEKRADWDHVGPRNERDNDSVASASSAASEDNEESNDAGADVHADIDGGANEPSATDTNADDDTATVATSTSNVDLLLKIKNKAAASKKKKKETKKESKEKEPGKPALKRHDEDRRPKEPTSPKSPKSSEKRGSTNASNDSLPDAPEPSPAEIEELSLEELKEQIKEQLREEMKQQMKEEMARKELEEQVKRELREELKDEVAREVMEELNASRNFLNDQPLDDRRCSESDFEVNAPQTLSSGDLEKPAHKTKNTRRRASISNTPSSDENSSNQSDGAHSKKSGRKDDDDGMLSVLQSAERLKFESSFSDLGSNANKTKRRSSLSDVAPPPPPSPQTQDSSSPVSPLRMHAKKGFLSKFTGRNGEADPTLDLDDSADDSAVTEVPPNTPPHDIFAYFLPAEEPVVYIQLSEKHKKSKDKTKPAEDVVVVEYPELNIHLAARNTEVTLKSKQLKQEPYRPVGPIRDSLSSNRVSVI